MVPLPICSRSLGNNTSILTTTTIMEKLVSELQLLIISYLDAFDIATIQKVRLFA